MSFTSFSASVNASGTTITITYSYSGAGTSIQAYVYQNGSESAVGSPQTPSNNITITSSDPLFSFITTQGAAYGLFLRDNDLVPNDSSKYYYIYCKTNDSSNIYLGSKTTNAPFILGDIGTNDKSAILPPYESSAGKIYYIKIKGSTKSFFLVPYITGITYPITSDQMLLTDDQFSAFDSSINLEKQRQVFTNDNFCYPFGCFGAGAGFAWLQLSAYNGTLSILNEPSSSFVGAKTINLDQQIHLYNYSNTSNNMIILSSLKGNCIHYFSMYRSASGVTTTVNLGFGDSITVDNNTVSSGNTNYISISMNQYDVFNLAFYVNSSTSKIYIINTLLNGTFTTSSGTQDTQINSSLVYSPSSPLFVVPTSLTVTNLATIKIVKYNPKTNRVFKMFSNTGGDNSIYVPTTGFSDSIESSSLVGLCIWMLVYNDSGISKVIMFHNYSP